MLSPGQQFLIKTGKIQNIQKRLEHASGQLHSAASHPPEVVLAMEHRAPAGQGRPVLQQKALSGGTEEDFTGIWKSLQL